MDIYIKPMEKVQIIGRRIIYLSDVAEVYAGNACQGELEKLPVFQIPENTENMYLLSVSVSYTHLTLPTNSRV